MGGTEWEGGWRRGHEGLGDTEPGQSREGARRSWTMGKGEGSQRQGGYGMRGVKIEGIEAGDTEWGTEAGEERRSWDTKGWGGDTEARTKG